jgi:DNA-binding transcriptional LysR family regulator
MHATDYAEFRAFAAVMRHGSFVRAAAHLGVTPSALSQTIRRLEDRLGLRLLNRTTRSVAPSHAGQALAARLLPVLDDLDGVLADAIDQIGEVSGPLRLNAAGAAVPLLADLVGPFLARHPRVVLDIAVSDALVDIVREGFDAGIRLGERLEGDMIAIPFGGDQRMIVVGAPDYLSRHGTPTHPRDLEGHLCLALRSPTDGSPYRWEFEKAGEALRIAVSGPLICNTVAIRVAAAGSGLGLTYVFAHQVVRELAEGRLVPVLGDWTPPFPGCSLYFPSRRNPSPALRAFVDIVRAEGRRPVAVA